MVDLTQAHKASIELLGTRHTALVEAVRNYVNGSVQPSIDELIAAIEDVTTDIDTKEKMLLGLASRQAKKPVPSLILDFKTRHYLQGTRRPEKGYGIHDLLTVERATPKWVFNASGRLTEVPANQPAYQHDPVTGEPQGLLIEESRTNRLTWSEDLTKGVWDKRDSSVETGGALSPADNTAQVVVDGGRVAHIRQTLSGVTPGMYTLTIHFKRRDHTFGWARFQDVGFIAPQVYVNLDTLEISYMSGEFTNAVLTQLSGGWIKLTVNVEVGSGDEVRIFVGGSHSGSFDSWLNDGDGTSGTYIWGAQLEEGSTPSSYIPTEDAPVTRAADSVSRELGDEFNPSSGTVFVDVVLPGDLTGSNYILQIADSTSSIRTGESFILWRSNGIVRFSQFAGGTGTSAISEVAGSGPLKIAFSYTPSEIRIAVNGVSASTAIAQQPDPERLTTLLLSVSHGGNRFRLTRSISCYPHALSEQELIDLTS